ncbi:terminase large subunit [Secundilactobacillus kimchicus]|uniref:terminase large subunit n=1 Tax=Secundilactobacillus kimchicus TaxID=528209 RepID=UPI0024A9FD49|nr:terminase TerL endonuclease subunit [Secundilactobacillus kimchicus]
MGAYKAADYTAIRTKYTDPGTQYAFDVLNGNEKTGYLIQLAAFRHLQDLKRVEEGVNNFKYVYDLDKVSAVLKFAAICPNVDTGEPTKLMPWQEFIMAQLIGWRTRDGNKRFTRAMVSVARGQGKTYLMAIISCYSYLIETIGLSNQDFLVSSINFKQTNKLFGYIKGMLNNITAVEPFKTLSRQNVLRPQNDQVVTKKTNNVLRAISHESGQYDSFHFTTAVFDEIGEVASRDKISKIISGQVKVPNHQFIQISTAYPNPLVPFHEDQEMMRIAMERDGDREADSYLALIWSQDDLDESYKPETWIKSNPLLGLNSQHRLLMNGLLDKRDSDLLSGTLSDFQNKNLNLWLQEAANSYLKLDEVNAAIVPSFDVTGRRVYIGLDYSMFSDNTAIGFVFPYMDGDKKRWHIAQHSFIPWHKAGSIEAKEKQDGIAYRELAKQGFCTITAHEAGLINDDQVYQWLRAYVDHYNLDVVFFGYDAWGATNAIRQLELNTNWPLEAIRQRTSELKDPTKFVQEKFAEGAFSRLDDKIMEKALLNAQVIEDKIGIQVDKAKATFKIDVVDAIIDAFYQGMFDFEDFSTVNDPATAVDRMSEQDVLEWFHNKESGLLG